MRCFVERDYFVRRKSTARWWKEPNDHGEISHIDCAYCYWRITKRSVGQPKSSKSGLGRYNRMRGAVVKHLHDEHREVLKKLEQEMK